MWEVAWNVLGAILFIFGTGMCLKWLIFGVRERVEITEEIRSVGYFDENSV